MSTVLCLLQHGDTVIAIDDVYGGVDRLLRRVAVPQWGLKYVQCDMMEMNILRELIPRDRPCMVWIETPTNPTLKVVPITDIVKTAKLANPHCIVIVDNTFATPCLQNPLLLHANLVLHSVTKYIGGHSDVLMGAVITNDDCLAERLAFLQKAMGAVPSPFDCFMALRGLKTLHVRVRQHCESALQVALFLARHPHIHTVHYPGLPTHPQHHLATTQMHNGYGGMLSFTLKTLGSEPALKYSVRLCKHLQVITLAESLGGVESLMDVPSVMTHAAVPEEQRIRLGITDGLLRLSVGLEDVEDIIMDLEAALRYAYSETDV